MRGSKWNQNYVQFAVIRWKEMEPQALAKLCGAVRRVAHQQRKKNDTTVREFKIFLDWLFSKNTRLAGFAFLYCTSIYGSNRWRKCLCFEESRLCIGGAACIQNAQSQQQRYWKLCVPIKTLTVCMSSMQLTLRLKMDQWNGVTEWSGMNSIMPLHIRSQFTSPDTHLSYNQVFRSYRQEDVHHRKSGK